jgi:hypothetical protein
MARLRALRSLRWNYRRRGVWVWLKGRQCFSCGGKGKVIQVVIQVPRPTGGGNLGGLATCSRCHGSPRRGYQRILSEPAEVIAEQTALAEGVFA